MSRKYLSCAETAKLVRSALSESFPGITFGVRSSVYSGGASITVKWTDGPTSKQVDAITHQFCGGYFDGMIDYKGSVYHTLDGEPVHFGADFIFTSHEHSDAAIKSAIDAIVTGYGGSQPITVAQYRRGEAWNWRNSGGCDLGRALNLYLSGESEASWLPAYAGMTAKPGKTCARVKFAGSDEYGAPYGANGYPRAA